MERQTPNLVRHPSQRSELPGLLDHPFDHPDDPTGPVWIRLDRRGPQREQARSVWSRPDRRRAPGYGSGAQPGRAGRCRTLGSRSGRAWLPGGGRSCCRLSSVAAAAVSPCPAAVAGVRGVGACRLPVVGRPRPVSTHPVSRSPLAASTWQVDQRRRANPTCGGLAVAPQRRLPVRRRPAAAGHRGRCRGGCGTGHRGRLGCPLLLPEPRSLSTRPVSGRLVSGRLTLPEPVGVHRYRNRSPARRPLDGCRHRR
jgi:hypothetical protein